MGEVERKVGMAGILKHIPEPRDCGDLVRRLTGITPESRWNSPTLLTSAFVSPLLSAAINSFSRTRQTRRRFLTEEHIILRPSCWFPSYPPPLALLHSLHYSLILITVDMPIATQTQTTPVPLYANPKNGSLRLRGNHVEPSAQAFPELDTKGVSLASCIAWQALMDPVHRGQECHLRGEGRCLC
jgi:hypothetical protein